MRGVTPKLKNVIPVRSDGGGDLILAKPTVDRFKARRLDSRQLAFARAIAEGKSGAEAQVVAGYLPNRANKNRLLDDFRIQDEIARLRALVDAEWARQQCETRLLSDPRVRAEIDRKAVELLVEWRHHQRNANQTETTGELD